MFCEKEGKEEVRTELIGLWIPSFLPFQARFTSRSSRRAHRDLLGPIQAWRDLNAESEDPTPLSESFTILWKSFAKWYMPRRAQEPNIYGATKRTIALSRPTHMIAVDPFS